VHTRSDLDIYILARSDPASLSGDFVERLRRWLKKRDFSIEIDNIGDIIYTDKESLDIIKVDDLMSSPLLLIGVGKYIPDVQSLRDALNRYNISIEYRIR